jgi:hypothetical protein
MILLASDHFVSPGVIPIKHGRSQPPLSFNKRKNHFVLLVA